MEKAIESKIDSFISDFDRKKLDDLDRMLFILLLEREILLIQKIENKKTKRISKVLLRYFDYRKLIYKRLKRKRRFNENDLLTRIFVAPERLILLVTHNCQLNCRYCRVSKFPSYMDENVLLRAIDLLFTSNRKDLELQFFGGEPLLNFDLIKRGVEYAERLNKKIQRNLIFLLTTNGIALTKEIINFLKQHNFIVECSIDGEIESQLRSRRACNGSNYYSRVLRNFGYLFDSNVSHYSISVVMPDNASSALKTFLYLIKIGFKKLQINYSLGLFWENRDMLNFFMQTDKIIEYVSRKKEISFINLTSARREPVVLNAELTVDCDGDIYLETGICLEEDFRQMKSKFMVTNINRTNNIHLFKTTPFQNFYRLSEAYGALSPKFRKIIVNNILLGLSYHKFIKERHDNYS